MSNKTPSKIYYVYRITNIIENKHYYGKRSCKILPKNDLGVKYFSSSHDKNFIQDQKDNPQNYKYKIIRVFNNTENALSFEIKLHNKFDVDVNESFYNKSKQTSIGFYFSVSGENNPFYGKTHSDEFKQKLSILKSGDLNPMYGKLHSKETRQKISDAHKGENNPFYGKTHSDEFKQKMSEIQKGGGNSQFGTMWITNGIKPIKIKKTDIIPDGYVRGRKIYNLVESNQSNH